MSLNSAYKSWHKPKKNQFNESGSIKKGATYQGYYKPTHPEKYIGNYGTIIFRSGWEYSFMKWCDFSESILKWSSEPLSIKFVDKISKLNENKKLGLDPNNPHNWTTKNYHVDFYCEVLKGDIIEKWFIEIKPSIKLKKPIPPKENAPLKEQKQFVIKASEYIQNTEKWKAMKEYAKKTNCKFYVFTEIELQKLGILGGQFDYTVS
jgi:hypothetical protein